MTPSALTLAPQTDPTTLYRLRDGLHSADLLILALIHLDLFSWLGEMKPRLTAAGFTHVSDRDTTAARGVLTARKPMADNSPTRHPA